MFLNSSIAKLAQVGVDSVKSKTYGQQHVGYKKKVFLYFVSKVTCLKKIHTVQSGRFNCIYSTCCSY